ncbi:MAG TPA: cyclic pyranopterin monophosphate synthase MoaC [Ktedonobacteraceae bacterium]|jgi:cyclic pyranopterin phosphate synthase
MADQPVPPAQLTHLDEAGRVRMVDVTGKQETLREAVARARVCMQPQTVHLIESNQVAKGNVLEVARIAAIMAAKQTPQLVPLCHPLPMTHIEVRFAVDSAAGTIAIEAQTRVIYRTGVEVEALTAALIAALTIYDMVKSVDHTVTLEQAYIARKTGGQSGVVEFCPPAR